MTLFLNISTAELILNLAFHSCCVLLIGFICIKFFKSSSAPLRSRIFLVLLLTLLVLPFLTLSFSALGIVPLTTHLPIILDKTGPAEEITHNLGTNEKMAPGAPFVAEKKGFLGQIDPGGILVIVINIFGMVWGFGCVLLWGRYILSAVVLRSLKKGAVRLNDQNVQQILSQCKAAFSRNITVEIFISSAVKGPMVLGLTKPIILIPTGLSASLNDRELKSIFLHELSHIFNRDQICGLLQTLAIMFNWWNPVVHSLSREVSRALEEIADNYVLFKQRSNEYAEFLINLAEKTLLVKPPRIVIAMASPHIPLKERVQNILSKERNMETKLKKSYAGKIILIAALGCIVLTGYQFSFTSERAELLSQEEQKKKEQKGSESDQYIVDPVRATGDIQPPELIKRADPIYPAAAKEKGIEGVVILELTTDIYGRVARVKILRSIPELDNAAIDAVKQWIYEPFIMDGKQRSVIFTVTCRFGTGLLPVRATGAIKPPQLIKRVDPVYPAAAKEKGIEGVVILELTTDIYGRVARVKILRSIPELDNAAIDAVKQWIYEPFILDKKPRGVIFTVSVRFTDK